MHWSIIIDSEQFIFPDFTAIVIAANKNKAISILKNVFNAPHYLNAIETFRWNATRNLLEPVLRIEEFHKDELRMVSQFYYTKNGKSKSLFP